MSTIFAIALVWQSLFLNHKTLENAKIASTSRLKCVQSPTYKKNTTKLEVLDDYKVVISLVFINYLYKDNLSLCILWKSQHRLRLGFNVALDEKK